MITVIATVGTSLFTNGLKEHNEHKGRYQALERARHTEWEAMSERVGMIRKALKRWAETNEDASAEITSLLKIRQELKGTITVRLLATDTVTSRLAAEIIRDVLNARREKSLVVEFDPRQDVIPGLQVEERTEFEKKAFIILCSVFLI